MAKTGGSVKTGSATRLVYTIGLIRWIAIGLIALAIVVATGLTFTEQSTILGAMTLFAWLYGAAAALVVYVGLGWLQQTLLMLIGIANNTGKDSELDFFRRT